MTRYVKMGDEQGMIVAKPAWRVFLVFLLGAVLMGPLIGVGWMTLPALAMSRESSSDLIAQIGPASLAWLVFAAPVTVPGGIIGATLAIRLARQKASSWSRRRWMVTGAFAGATVATLLTAAYYAALGGSLLERGPMVPGALLLGFVVGWGTACVAYHDLEALQRGHAA